MHTTRSVYGAPEPESAAQALARVDTFITHHQACGDLVFQKRVNAAHITEDLLACIEAQALSSYSTSHRDRRTRRSNRLHPGANRVDQMTWDVGSGAREDSADQDSREVAESGPIGGIDVYRRRPRGV
ncbi:hypothetical protein [Rhodococcus erythropolis]|uniref:Uncharacterized protein n=1 Tax=Rhodococcus erythropolis TaxID=1833 RepID=A0A8I0ZLR5_RHOER|nr:hypothetical protein [Rhodococcus erythropolis]MBH5141846.1 hypothetical protein [Rhodococcus erythropolis]